MIRGLIGKKIGMTEIFNKEGNMIPVTVVETGPCTILELKETPIRKVTVGFEPIKESRVNKPRLGLFKKVGVLPLRTIREFPSTDNKDYKLGQELKADVFKAGDWVDVTGTSIGKGFQGGMKLHHWRGGGATHGSMHHRRVGSISASTDPGRTVVGHPMPAHMGAQTKTVQGLRVMAVNLDKNFLLIKGAVPGYVSSTLLISLSQKKKFKALDEKRVVVAHKVNPMKQSKKAAGAAAKAKIAKAK